MGLIVDNFAGGGGASTGIEMALGRPRELFRAQGFPDSYVIDPIVNGRPLPKSAQVRMVGNSVCPPVAAAIVQANVAREVRDVMNL